MRFTRMALAAGSAALLAGAMGTHAGASGSGDALAVRTWSGWDTWWRRDGAPARWTAAAPLAARHSPGAGRGGGGCGGSNGASCSSGVRAKPGGLALWWYDSIPPEWTSV